MGALGLVGRGFGPAGRAGLGWAWGLAVLGALAGLGGRKTTTEMRCFFSGRKTTNISVVFSGKKYRSMVFLLKEKTKL